jgi:putative hydrolase of the HAD superfamily
MAPEAVQAYLFGGRLEDDYEAGRVSTAVFLGLVRETCRLRGTDEQLRAAFADMFWPNPEVCDLVPLLAPRYRLVLLSNTNELHAAFFQRSFADVLRHFDHLVLSFEIGIRKPLAGFFEHCQRLAGAAPQDCIFIDDLPDNVGAAQALGWHGIVYKPGNDLPGALERLGVHIES